MLELLHLGKQDEQDGKIDLVGVLEEGTIGSMLRRHRDDQIRSFKPDNRSETTKEHS